MSVIHNVAHFVRWRLIALRYAGKLRGWAPGRAFARAPRKTAKVRLIESQGFDAGPVVPPHLLAEMTQRYAPRAVSEHARDRGHPFVNLFVAEDIDAGSPVVQMAFSPQVLDVADDYFGGRLILDSLQVLYSWPMNGELRESQKWHKDYADTRSFHWIAYLNDVRSPDDGPFTFIDKKDTQRISHSLFIRRISDDAFASELGVGKVREFLGSAGESVFVDPAVCYHNGSRCKNPRLAVFVTFSTTNPFVDPTPLIRANRLKIFEVGKKLRPDLNESYLKRLLQIH